MQTINFKRLRTSITYMTSLLIFLIFICLGFVTFNLNRALTTSNIETIHKGITSKVLLKLDSYLSIPHTVNDLNEAYLRIGHNHYENLELLRKYFYKQMSIFKTINLIAFGTEDGKYVESQRLRDGEIRTGDGYNGNLELWKTNSSGEKVGIEKVIKDYDPRLRPWYDASRKKQTRAWSDIYLFSSNKQPAISANQPYFSEGLEFEGVLTTSLTLTGIGDFLSDFTKSDNSAVLLMDSSGLTIATSRDIPVLDKDSNRIPAVNLDDPVFSAVSEKYYRMSEYKQNSPVSAFSLWVNRNKYLVETTPYPGPYGLEWNVIVIIPEADYMGAYNKATLYGIGFLIIFLFITVFSSYLIAGRISGPIEKLSRLFSQISWNGSADRKWTIPETILKRKDEIGILAGSFSGMAKRLETAFRDVKLSEKKYRELIEDTNSIIFRLKPDGEISFANSYALNYFGYAEGELLNRKFQEILLPKTTENGEDQSQLIQKIFADNELYWLHENENIKKNGERVWFLWSNKLIPDDENNTVELLSVGQDITARKEAEKELNVSLGEKNILLSEIHHRIKNNLQMITSLITLQIGDISNKAVQEPLESLRDRIQSIAMVHKMLYTTEAVSEINFHDYLKEILDSIVSMHFGFENKIQVSLAGDVFNLDIDRSTTCGLIVNELVINAFKYAFLDQEDRRIDVNLVKENTGEITLTVKDNGIGIPKAVNKNPQSGLGTILVDALTEQLGGKIYRRNEKGTEITLVFQT